MTKREQKLALGFGLVIVVFLGRIVVNSWILEPIRTKKSDLASAENAVNQLEFQEVQLIVAQANLNNAKEFGLPEDPLLAQLIYQEWVTELANAFELRGLEVAPIQRSSKSKVFTSVKVSLEARATREQLARFLYAFENAAITHRISSLHLECKEHRGNPLIDVVLDAEGLSMPGSPERASVFPRLKLPVSLTETETTLKLPQASVPAGFPTEAPFVVRIGKELLNVEDVTENGWNLKRGALGTTVASHAVDDQLELLRFRSDAAEFSQQRISRIADKNFFVKPAEPIEYNPQLDPIGDKVATRGQTLSFQVTSSGFPPETPPRFVEFDGDELKDLYFDKESGDVIWEPDEDTELGEYELTFYLYVKGEESQRDSERITIRVRDPNTSPRLELKDSYTVLAGSPFRLELKAEDDESSARELTYAIEGELPEGAEFSSATGVLSWSPSENELPREIPVTVTVTDRGDPPMSDRKPVTLSLIEDFTRDTFLTGIIKVDEVPQASLYNRAENVTSLLFEGKPFRAAGLTGTVLKISTEYVVCEMDDEIWRLELGKPLFERQKSESQQTVKPVNSPDDAEEPLVAPKASSAPVETRSTDE